MDASIEELYARMSKCSTAFKHRGTNFSLIPKPQIDLPEIDLAEDFEIHLPLYRKCGFENPDFPQMLPLRYARSAQVWSRYISTLAGAFCEAFRTSACNVRFSEISDDQCRLFHADNVRVRLIQTLCGPGTEFLSEANLFRQGLGLGRNELIVRDPEKVLKAQEGQILLMRGARWFKHAALVHRSPPIEHLHLRRLYVCLDIKDPGEVQVGA